MGVFMPVIARENGFTTTQISLIFSFAGVGAVLTGMFVTPTALKKLGPRVCMMVSTVLTAGHLLWYSFATHLAELFISATFGGVAIGFGLYAATGTIVGNWFVRNRMAMLGIISAGSGLGSAAFNAAVGSLILAQGYRTTYVILFVVVLALGLVLQLGIRSRPSDVGQTALGYVPAGKTAASAPGMELPGVAFKEALKKPSFYLLFIAGICGSIAWTGVNMYMVTLLTNNYAMPIDVASRYDAVLRICVAVALIFSGRIAEKIGTKGYILYIGVTFGTGVLITLLTGSAIAEMPLLLFSALVLMSVGASHSSANGQILANGIFGPRDFATFQSYLIAGLHFGLASSAVVAAPFVGSDGNVLGCFTLFLVCSVVWMVLALAAALLSPYKKMK